MKLELAILRSQRLGHGAAAQDAVNFPWVPPGSMPSPTPFPSPTPIANVGQYGTPGSLPMNPGPVEPDFLDQGPGGYSYMRPSIEINPATGGPAGYPVPGAGAQPPRSPSLLGRMAGNIPAVRLVKLIASLFNRPVSPRDNARSNPAPRAVAVRPDAALGGPVQSSITPNTRTHWDFTRGTMVPNNFVGGAQFDSRMQNALQMWDAGRPQPVNNTGTTRDRGHDRFYGNQGYRADEYGGFSPVDFVDDPAAAGRTAASQALYQQALRAVPMDRGGYTSQYAQRVNDWITAHQDPSMFNPIAEDPSYGGPAAYWAAPGGARPGSGGSPYLGEDQGAPGYFRPGM